MALLIDDIAPELHDELNQMKGKETFKKASNMKVELSKGMKASNKIKKNKQDGGSGKIIAKKPPKKDGASSKNNHVYTDLRGDG